MGDCILKNPADFIYTFGEHPKMSNFRRILKSRKTAEIIQIFTQGILLIQTRNICLQKELLVWLTFLAINYPYVNLLLDVWLPFLTNYATRTESPEVPAMLISLSAMCVESTGLLPWCKDIVSVMEKTLVPSLATPVVDIHHLASPWEAALGVMLGVGPTLLEAPQNEILSNIAWNPSFLDALRASAGVEHDLTPHEFWSQVKALVHEEQFERQTTRVRRQLGRRLVERVSGARQPHDKKVIASASLLQVFGYAMFCMCKDSSPEQVIGAFSTELKLQLREAQKTNEVSSTLLHCLHSFAMGVSAMDKDKLLPFTNALFTVLASLVSFESSCFEKRMNNGQTPSLIYGGSFLATYADLLATLKNQPETELNQTFQLSETHNKTDQLTPSYSQFERAIDALLQAVLGKLSGPRINQCLNLIAS